MYKEFTFKDGFVFFLSLMALAALIFIVRYSDAKAKQEQEVLSEISKTQEQFTQQEPSSNQLENGIVMKVDKSGWIELYNSGKQDINLTGGSIEINGIEKYVFEEETILGAKEAIRIEDLGTSGQEIIVLLNENGSIMRKKMVSDVQQAVKFSVPAGFYAESFELELVTEKKDKIYYTLDGSNPDETSFLYEKPILIENKSGSTMRCALDEGIVDWFSYVPTSISMGMVVKAISIDSSGKKSDIITHSYFIGLSQSGEYENISVLSISTEYENLFDYFNGIYVVGRSREDAIARGEEGASAANYYNCWIKPVHVEYFEAEKDKTFDADMELGILHDISITLPQKSLLLTGSGEVLEGSDLKSYYNEFSKSLTVQTNRRDNDYKIREYIAANLLENTSVGMPDIKPCIVFINGEFWGGYMLRAPYDQAYIQEHYQVENTVTAQNWKIQNEEETQRELEQIYKFVTEKDMSNRENYEWVKEHIDIENYLEYFCANMYFANADYGNDAFSMWKSKSITTKKYEDGKWRFLMPTLDLSMDNGAIGEVATSSIDTFLQTNVTQDVFLQSLLRNNEFKQQMKTVMNKLSKNIFNMENVEEVIQETAIAMKKLALTSYKRFYGIPSDSFYASEIEKIMKFFERREDYVSFYIEEFLEGGGILHD